MPIEKQVFEGQSLMVQVIKDPIGTKGARLSTQISIAGRLLVFLPQDDHVGVSQKIGPSSATPARALNRRWSARRRRRLHPAHQCRGRERRGAGGGHRLPAQDLARGSAKRPRACRRASLLHQDLNLLQRVLRDLVTDETQTIRIDSREQFALLQAFGASSCPRPPSKLQLYKGERPIFDLYSVDEEIARRSGAGWT